MSGCCLRTNKIQIGQSICYTIANFGQNFGDIEAATWYLKISGQCKPSDICQSSDNCTTLVSAKASTLCRSKKYPYSSHRGFFALTPSPAIPLQANSNFGSHFPLKSLAFEMHPLPLEISSNPPWGGYGYFLDHTFAWSASWGLHWNRFLCIRPLRCSSPPTCIGSQDTLRDKLLQFIFLLWSYTQIQTSLNLCDLLRGKLLS